MPPEKRGEALVGETAIEQVVESSVKLNCHELPVSVGLEVIALAQTAQIEGSLGCSGAGFACRSRL